MVEPWRHLTRLVWHGELPPRDGWDALLKVAQRNGLLPLVAFLALQQEGGLSKYTANCLREARRHTMACQIIMAHQIEQLARVASGLDMPVMVLKGPVVAQTYPHPAARSSVDIDLLVLSKNSARVLSQALHRVSYTPQAGCREWGQVPSLHPRIGTFDVEVHFQLGAGVWELPMVEIWKRATPLVESRGLWEMDEVDHALYIMVHGIEQHELKLGLRLLYDLSCWTQEWSQESWGTLIARAKAWGMLPTVRLTCGLWCWVDEKAWEDMPFGRLLSPPPVGILALAKQTMTNNEVAHLPKVWGEGAGSGLKGWLRYGWAILTRGGNIGLMQFPERLEYLLGQHGPALWQLLRGDSRARSKWRDQRLLYAWLREEKRR